MRNTGKVKEAKEAYFKALKIDETNWLAYYNLGLCYMNEDAYAKATENFKFAISYFPNFAQAYHELGKAFFYQAKTITKAHWQTPANNMKKPRNITATLSNLILI